MTFIYHISYDSFVSLDDIDEAIRLLKKSEPTLNMTVKSIVCKKYETVVQMAITLPRRSESRFMNIIDKLDKMTMVCYQFKRRSVVLASIDCDTYRES